MMVVGLPALEVAWLMVTRWQRGVSPGEGGRDHLHFRLQDMGIGERELGDRLSLFCAGFGVLTLWVDSRVYKLAALGGVDPLRPGRLCLDQPGVRRGSTVSHLPSWKV